MNRRLASPSTSSITKWRRTPPRASRMSQPKWSSFTRTTLPRASNSPSHVPGARMVPQDQGLENLRNSPSRQNDSLQGHAAGQQADHSSRSRTDNRDQYQRTFRDLRAGLDQGPARSVLSLLCRPPRRPHSPGPFGRDHRAPWHVYEPGALRLEGSGFPTKSSEIDPPERFRRSVAIGDLRPHIASPDVHVDQARRQIVMHFHGLERDCTQTTRRAVSEDGLDFRDPRPTGADFYARVFEWHGVTYAAALEGWLYRSRDSGLSFPDRARLGDPSTRHVAVFPFGDELFLVFSRIGDAPERLLISRILATGNWRDWRLSDPLELLRAEMPWEGAGEPVLPSRMGPADKRVNQLRDPFIFSEGGRLWLIYACAGESGLALAQLHCR